MVSAVRCCQNCLRHATANREIINTGFLHIQSTLTLFCATPRHIFTLFVFVVSLSLMCLPQNAWVFVYKWRNVLLYDTRHFNHIEIVSMGNFVQVLVNILRVQPYCHIVYYMPWPLWFHLSPFTSILWGTLLKCFIIVSSYFWARVANNKSYHREWNGNWHCVMWRHSWRVHVCDYVCVSSVCSAGVYPHSALGCIWSPLALTIDQCRTFKKALN